MDRAELRDQEREEREKELSLLKKKLVFSIILGAVIMVLSMPHFIPYAKGRSPSDSFLSSSLF